MRLESSIIRGISVLFVLACSGLSHADELPAAVFNIIVQGQGGGVFHNLGNYSSNLSTLSIADVPTVAISADAPDGTGSSMTGNATWYFEFFYTGPGQPPESSIPVMFHTVLFAEADTSGHGYGSADFQVDDGDGGIGATLTCGLSAPVCTQNTIDTVLSGNISVNQAHSVFVSAGASAPNGPGFSMASVDPMIYIDPGFADANLYTLELSPGVGNADPSSLGAPEPSSWMLAGLGVIGLAFGTHRRRRLVN